MFSAVAIFAKLSPVTNREKNVRRTETAILLEQLAK